MINHIKEIRTPRAETAAGWRKYDKNSISGGELGTCFDIVVLREENIFPMYFSWRPQKSIALVESTDGIHWQEPHILLAPNPGSGWEDNINRPSVIRRMVTLSRLALHSMKEKTWGSHRIGSDS